MQHLSWAAALPALVIGIIASLVGGAAGGVLVGGKSLGNQLAATMGGFFGPLAGAGGLVIGLIAITLFS